MAEDDTMDPADALKRLLAERELARRSVYAANIARERAEEERDHEKKLLGMQIEEGQKLAAENADLRSKLERADKSTAEIAERAEEEQERAERAERREKILETILGRVENELHDAILEEDDFVPAGHDPTTKPLDYTEEIEEEMKPGHDPAAKPFDYTEDETRETRVVHDKTNIPFYALPFIAAHRVIAPRWQVFSLALAAPFALMTLLLGLASLGIVVDALRPLWSPWPDDAMKWAIGLLGTSVFLFLPLNSMFGGRRKGHTIDSTLTTATTDQPAPPADEKDEYLAALREIFGEDDDDAEGPK